MLADQFAPFNELAAALLPYVQYSGDGAHDAAHLGRVWRNARQIQTEEGGDLEILAAAVLLHDSVAVRKNSPERKRASRLAALKARDILRSLGWTEGRIEVTAGAIETHSYSAGMEPLTLEGRVLQDADRLDAIGFIGIARCFYTAGQMSSQLYNAADPPGEKRELNDGEFALDHFPKKLLLLSEGFKTATGERLARERNVVLETFYRGMLREISG